MFCFIFLLFYFAVQINADCPNGYVTSYSNSSICYIFKQYSFYFLEADQFCETLGGHLVSIHNMFDNVLISEYALEKFTNSTNNDFWIGANDLMSKGKWSWLDNTPFDFSDWEKGQPQNISGADCGVIKMQGGLWAADDCFTQKPFVCAISATSTKPPTTQVSVTQTTENPKGCDDTWTYYNYTNSCYKVFLNQTWLDAEERCNIDHAHLASIHSHKEDVFIMNLASPYSDSSNWWTGQTWVGFFTEDNNKQWHWTDGTPFDYVKWAAAYNPDNPGVENCGQIWTGELTQRAINEGYTCGDFNNFVCKTVVSNYVCKKSPN